MKLQSGTRFLPAPTVTGTNNAVKDKLQNLKASMFPITRSSLSGDTKGMWKKHLQRNVSHRLRMQHSNDLERLSVRVYTDKD